MLHCVTPATASFCQAAQLYIGHEGSSSTSTGLGFSRRQTWMRAVCQGKPSQTVASLNSMFLGDRHVLPVCRIEVEVAESDLAMLECWRVPNHLHCLGWPLPIRLHQCHRKKVDIHTAAPVLRRRVNNLKSLGSITHHSTPNS